MVTRRANLRKADVVTLGVLACIGAALLPPALAKMREADARSRCAANVNGIMKAMIVYSADNNDCFPSTSPEPTGTKYSVNFDDKMGKPGAISGAREGDPTACLWMLVPDGSISSKSLLCQSDSFAGAPAVLARKDDAESLVFQKANQLSYSIAYPWTKTNDGKGTAGGWWKATIDSSLPIMTDMAPFNEPKANPVIDPAMKNAVDIEVNMALSATEPGTRSATEPDVRPQLDAILPRLNDDSPAVRAAAEADLAKLGRAGVQLVGAMDLTKQPLQTRVALKTFLQQMKDEIVTGKTYNSPNHGYVGQNVGFADAHAEWTKTPVLENAPDKHNFWLSAGKDGEQAISPGDIGTPITNSVPYKTVMVPARARDGSVK